MDGSTYEPTTCAIVCGMNEQQDTPTGADEQKEPGAVVSAEQWAQMQDFREGRTDGDADDPPRPPI